MSIVDFNSQAWNKKWIRELPSDAKVLFFYLWTNDHKNLIAMYEIDIEKISFELGMKQSKIKEMFELLHPKVRYDYSKHTVWVVNHFRHQFMRTENISSKVIEGARKCLIGQKGHPFVAEFIDNYKSLNLFNTERQYPYPIDRVSEGFTNPPGGGVGEGKGGDIFSLSPKKEKKKPLTGMPDDFGISDRVKTWASENGYTQLDEHLKSFKLTATSKGYQYVDWDAAFMKAVRENWAKLGGNVNGPGLQATGVRREFRSATEKKSDEQRAQLKRLFPERFGGKVDSSSPGDQRPSVDGSGGTVLEGEAIEVSSMET